MHLTGLGLLFVLRKLGKVMGEKERMLSSEAALIKQVTTRLIDDESGPTW